MNRLLIYSLAIFILGLAVALRITWLRPETKLPRNQPITFIATVKTQPKISGLSQVIKVADARVYTDLFPTYRVGDRLRIEGEVEENGNIFRPKVEVVGRVPSAWYRVAGIREKISNNIKQLLPAREATLVVGAVLGVDDIERDFRDQLIKTGTIHVVVVSGQNLAIVAGLFLSLAKFIGRRQSMILAVVAAFGYALLTGFEPPVVRASLMVIFSSIAIYYGREKMAIWNLIIAALVIVFFSPQAIFEISFQLTFAATLGIVTLGQRLSNISKKFESRISKSETNTNLRSFLSEKQNSKSKKVSNLGHLDFDIVSSLVLRISDLLIKNAAIATSAYIFTAPIIFLNFGTVSFIAPFVNVLVAELVFPIMILGFLTAGVSLIFMPLAQIFAYFAFVPAFIFVSLVSVFSNGF